MRSLIAVAALVAAFLSALPASAACSAKHVEMLYPVVLVATGGGSGSGTVVFSGKRDEGVATLVLTNWHVIADSVSVSEEWDPAQGKKVERERRRFVELRWFQYNNCSRAVGALAKQAEIMAYDRRADLALLRARDTENTVEHVARILPEGELVYLGEETFAVGAGLGKPPFMTAGHVAYQDEQIEGYRYLMATSPIIFGNSGGALFRFSSTRGRYELIGVPSRVSAAGWSAVSHMAWSIPAETIREFLRRDHAYILE